MMTREKAETDRERPEHFHWNYVLMTCLLSFVFIAAITGNFTCVSVSFTLKRRLGYYIFHTYIPTCLIVIMSWISFWIRPDAVPARVTLCVTSLLTLSTQHAQSQKSLPPVSYIKAIDIFMSCCTLFVFASLMEYALVNILMASDDKFNRKLLRNTFNTTEGGTTNPKKKVSSFLVVDNTCMRSSITRGWHRQQVNSFPTICWLNLLNWYRNMIDCIHDTSSVLISWFNIQSMEIE